ncbi:MAG TPA: aminoglycoside adenylyltransferase family protein [Candidatus Deferrimicrobiaceae bacterium]|nr:aminoglycoside adenylyltransferase family protein [Candidatus Deferrimicrobiaceae bacterium]
MSNVQRADPLAAVVDVVRRVLADTALGAALHGSAVLGGLRPTSDVDVLVISSRSLIAAERRALVSGLLEVSGHRARRGPARPVELAVVVARDIRPWRFPPPLDFMYGEWLRDAYEAGEVPEPTPSPDLALLLTVAREHGRVLVGQPPRELLDPVPMSDVRASLGLQIPGLMEGLESDTRNVLLTLARAWRTQATGEIVPKDVAAAWAAERLRGEGRRLIQLAGAMYRGEVEEPPDEAAWRPHLAAARALAEQLVGKIEAAAPDERSTA